MLWLVSRSIGQSKQDLPHNDIYMQSVKRSGKTSQEGIPIKETPLKSHLLPGLLYIFYLSDLFPTVAYDDSLKKVVAYSLKLKIDSSRAARTGVLERIEGNDEESLQENMYPAFLIHVFEEMGPELTLDTAQSNADNYFAASPFFPAETGSSRVDDYALGHI